MGFLIDVLFIVACFFAWAIGGEKHFGHWRRGMLLLVPYVLYAFHCGLPLFIILLQIPIFWAIYQALGYDGIELVYEEQNPKKWQRQLRGWVMIALSGALISITNFAFFASRSWDMVIGAVILGIIAFIIPVILSNASFFKGYRDMLNKYMPSLPYLRFKDAWYVSEGLIGAGIGAIAVWLM